MTHEWTRRTFVAGGAAALVAPPLAGCGPQAARQPAGRGGPAAAPPGAERFDVAIIGGGPAGLEAALVLSRARKRVVVFDAPSPPRNGASHGVHNFLGLEGATPARVREAGWAEIRRYESAELRREAVVDVARATGAGFTVEGDRGTRLAAGRLLLAFGYRDEYPDISGFAECWADTIIPCPFCDGYENRDRAWGVGGDRSEAQALSLARMSRNWARSVAVFPGGRALSPEAREALARDRIAVHEGRVVRFEHRGGKLEAAWLDSGARVALGTMLWSPAPKPVPLLGRLADGLGLAVNEKGQVQTDAEQATNVEGVWAAGDVQGWAGASGAAFAGQKAAVAMVHDWFKLTLIRAGGPTRRPALPFRSSARVLVGPRPLARTARTRRSPRRGTRVEPARCRPGGEAVPRA